MQAPPRTPTCEEDEPPPTAQGVGHEGEPNDVDDNGGRAKDGILQHSRELQRCHAKGPVKWC